MSDKYQAVILKDGDIMNSCMMTDSIKTARMNARETLSAVKGSAGAIFHTCEAEIIEWLPEPDPATGDVYKTIERFK
jgi:glycerate-2-kinase